MGLIKAFRKKFNIYRKREKEVIGMCEEIARKDCFAGSVPTFQPEEADLYIYEDLVKLGIMARDPMEENSYMFYEDYIQMHKIGKLLITREKVVAVDSKGDPSDGNS